MIKSNAIPPHKVPRREDARIKQLERGVEAGKRVVEQLSDLVPIAMEALNNLLDSAGAQLHQMEEALEKLKQAGGSDVHTSTELAVKQLETVVQLEESVRLLSVKKCSLIAEDCEVTWQADLQLEQMESELDKIMLPLLLQLQMSGHLEKAELTAPDESPATAKDQETGVDWKSLEVSNSMSESELKLKLEVADVYEAPQDAWFCEADSVWEREADSEARDISGSGGSDLAATRQQQQQQQQQRQQPLSENALTFVADWVGVDVRRIIVPDSNRATLIGAFRKTFEPELKKLETVRHSSGPVYDDLIEISTWSRTPPSGKVVWACLREKEYNSDLLCDGRELQFKIPDPAPTTVSVPQTPDIAAQTPKSKPPSSRIAQPGQLDVSDVDDPAADGVGGNGVKSNTTVGQKTLEWWNHKRRRGENSIPFTYRLPELPPNLQFAFDEILKTPEGERPVELPSTDRNDLIWAVANDMMNYATDFYPRSEEYDRVARAVVTKYPFLGDPIKPGQDEECKAASIRRQLVQRFKTMRLRESKKQVEMFQMKGDETVLLRTKEKYSRRKRALPCPASDTPALLPKAKRRRGLEPVKLMYDEGADRESVAADRQTLLELCDKREKPHLITGVKEIMARTKLYRRTWTLTVRPLWKEVGTDWPTLRTKDGIYAELQLQRGANFARPISDFLTVRRRRLLLDDLKKNDNALKIMALANKAAVERGESAHMWQVIAALPHLSMDPKKNYGQWISMEELCDGIPHVLVKPDKNGEWGPGAKFIPMIDGYQASNDKNLSLLECFELLVYVVHLSDIAWNPALAMTWRLLDEEIMGCRDWEPKKFTTNYALCRARFSKIIK